MRYGIADIRNYDSIELSRNLAWFADLYEPEPERPTMQTSRRTILWSGVERSIEKLRLARVAAIVGAEPPANPRLFAAVERVGRVWIARLDPIQSDEFRTSPGEIRIDLKAEHGQVGWIAETFDPGWKAEVDGRRVSPFPFRSTFLAVNLPNDARRVIFRYEPAEVRIAGAISLVALFAIVILACGERTSKKTI
jgi:hypothetical protein